MSLNDDKKTYSCTSRRSPFIRRSKITNEIIQQKAELLKAVVAHSEKVISQLLGNLCEAEKAAKDKPSPFYLTRLLRYLKDDIEPLADLIPLISLNAEKLGSLKAEFMLQKEFSDGMKQLYTTLSASCVEGTSHISAYKTDIDSHLQDKLLDNTPNPRYSTSSEQELTKTTQLNKNSSVKKHSVQNMCQQSLKPFASSHMSGDKATVPRIDGISTADGDNIFTARQPSDVRRVCHKVVSMMLHYSSKIGIRRHFILKNTSLLLAFLLLFLYFMKVILSFGCEVINYTTSWFIPTRHIPM